MSFIPGRSHRWLRFGRRLKERSIDRVRRQAYFTPHAVFCYVSWRGNEDGVADWRLDVLRAVKPNEHTSPIEGITPGAEIQLRVTGNFNVKHVLWLIAGMESNGIRPEAISPSDWRAIHHQLVAHELPTLDELTNRARASPPHFL